MLISGLLMGSNRSSKIHTECSHISVLRQPLCLRHRHITLLTVIASFWVSIERREILQYMRGERNPSSWNLVEAFWKHSKNSGIISNFFSLPAFPAANVPFSRNVIRTRSAGKRPVLKFLCYLSGSWLHFIRS